MIIDQEQRLGGTEYIRTLYGDLLLHTHATDDLYKNQSLDNLWQRSYLLDYSTNALMTPNITDWEEIVEGRLGIFRKNRTMVLSPNSSDHVALIGATKRAYTELRWEQLRLLLGGELGLQVENPQTPITPEESLAYLTKAQEQNLFHLESQPSKPAKFTVADPMAILYEIEKYRILLDGNLFERWKEIQWDPRFSQRIRTLAVDKLGCYLAVADQVTIDAQAQDNPIPASYKPTTLLESVEVYYRNKYGREIPTIGELYKEAHTIFLNLRDPIKNPLTQHLVAQNSLPFLV